MELQRSKANNFSTGEYRMLWKNKLTEFEQIETKSIKFHESTYSVNVHIKIRSY